MSQEEKKKQAGPRRLNHTDGRQNRPFMSGALTYVLFVIGLSALLAGIGWVTASDVLALNKPEHTAVITVAEGADFNDVVDELKDNGIIEYKLVFRIFSFFSGAADKVTAGTYELNTDMDYGAIVNNMSRNSASRQQAAITIPEGYTVQQIFQLLEEKGVSTVDKLNDTAASHDYAFSFLQGIPLGDATRLEGYLFPDTYNFYLGDDPLYVLNKMLVNFDGKITESMRKEITDSGKTVRDVLIIASMIEKETDGSDQSTIASVIYNRLNNTSAETAGFLNIDASIQYVLPAGQVVTQEDYKTVDSPYNTYLYKGLPPGPISNPGMTAIRAAMNPDHTGYYFYALGDDGVHHFFNTYAEFQKFLASLKHE